MWEEGVLIYDPPRVHNNFPQKSLKLALSFIEKWQKLGGGLTSLNEKWCKVCGTRWFFAEANKGHSAILVSVWEIETQRETGSFCEWKPKYWEQDTEFWEVQSEWRKREMHGESVREWKRKRKRSHFFFCWSYIHKEDKLVEFSWSFWVLQPWRVGVFRWRFCYWFCGEIVYYSLRFNLLCIQFIVDSSLA